MARVINLAYDDRGTGEPVLFIAGRGGAGRTWHLYQVPALARAGYTTEIVSTGKGALQKLGQTDFDLVILDLRIPFSQDKEATISTGVDILKEIGKISAGLPVITTRIGEAEEIINDSRAGTIVESCPRSIAGAATEILINRQRAEDYAQAAIRYAPRLDWSAVLEPALDFVVSV